ncbi:N-6 DNA methylase [Actinomadura pelletieri DSM 43383]|uniref:site-specific DNA-methyltransferase (adenine-specific) n=1 Tax=Actinomadura pelletieri DSM 43383 TaxID=1120940 RepID=A0A495QZ85_9ACTN|nr:DNA methyltransferase [Actinomadura pelletieri]RKS79493.1 N-6 DNA methylase [Actinomadura pelletieri DSM 43383]
MSATARTQIFSAVHTIGGLLPADMLVRISEGKDVQGTGPADYDIFGSRSVRDEAERHWDYLKSVWKDLRDRLPVAPEAETPADPTGLAIRQWLEPLFAELSFGRLTALGTSGIQSDDGTKTFAISHLWTHVPIHLAAWNTRLDTRPGGPGTIPPQSLMQECLNRTEAHLWAVLTNGRQLRLLRDSSALATAAYVEFDLEAIFDGELFSEFVLLYRLLHASRFAVDDGAAPSTCWLEKWRTDAIDSGTRALDHHRDGVQKAITALGTGFLKHPANAELLRDLDVHAFHGALLRLAYRLIFLFVAEDRDVLHPKGTPDDVRERYRKYFSSARLRQQAQRRRGTAHTDLYQALKIVLDALGDENGRPELGIPGLGGLYDDTPADAPLHGLALSNVYLLEAVRHLSRIHDGDTRRWRPVDYRNMGAEELGSIYESLLELVPKHSAVERTFELVDRLGNDRKKTGSYYTPSSLIETLLDSTLDPVIDDAQKRGEEKAAAAGKADPTESIVSELLSLTVCDPACGSGHFLVASARRIAKRVAAVRESNPEPTLDAVRHALHEVIGRCVYGVDLNPMAVELAKVSLWLEALEPGKPLGFLDAHIKLGNGLIGATPVLLKDGIPTKAFKPVEGDDPAYANFLAKQNDKERQGQGGLFDLFEETKVANTAFAESLRRITAAPANTLRDVHRQADAYEEWKSSAEYAHAVHVADAWCAAFMWHKTKDAPTPITHDVFRALQDPNATATGREVHDEIARLSKEYRFFHWHLEFPEVFTVPDEDKNANVDQATGWAGGFSSVLANPPWDRLEFEDTKYFSVVEPSIAQASGAARAKSILVWEKGNPEGSKKYRAERRKLKATNLFASTSEAFPLCAKGLTAGGVTKLQVDQLFTERFLSIIGPHGRIGCIIPTAIATSAGGQYLFSSLTRRGAIASLYDFENSGKPLFPRVHTSYKFCLLSLVGRSASESAARFAFFMQNPAELDDANKVFTLTPDEINLINPNTGTLPIFRTRRDANLTLAIHRHLPLLNKEGEKSEDRWHIDFKYLFRSANDGDVFRTRQELEDEGWSLQGNVFAKSGKRMLPMYEGKMAHHFDHRYNSFYGTGNEDRERLAPTKKQDPATVAYPRYWIGEGPISSVRRSKQVEVSGVTQRLRQVNWERDWLCGWRDVCRTTDERTAISAFIPRAAVGHKFPLMLVHEPAELVAALIATQSSLVFDYVSRQKVGGPAMSLFIWKQLPVPSPLALSVHTPFITPRVLELVYTAYDMAALARDLGDQGEPFVWSEERRVQIRAELDAYFLHLYDIDREDAEHILETFQTEFGGLKKNEIAKYGTYRTKDLVLSEYDRMAEVGVDLDKPLGDGENYTSMLNPPPGHGPRHG